MGAVLILRSQPKILRKIQKKNCGDISQLSPAFCMYGLLSLVGIMGLVGDQTVDLVGLVGLSSLLGHLGLEGLFGLLVNYCTLALSVIWTRDR